MGMVSYFLAALLVIGWAIGRIIFGHDRGIHVLLVMALATVIQEIIQSNRFSHQQFRSSDLKKGVWKMHTIRAAWSDFFRSLFKPSAHYKR